MTIRLFIVLLAVGFLLAAAISLAGIDLFGITPDDPDALGWGFFGLALYAISTVTPGGRP